MRKTSKGNKKAEINAPLSNNKLSTKSLIKLWLSMDSPQRNIYLQQHPEQEELLLSFLLSSIQQLQQEIPRLQMLASCNNKL
jgi:hypothetical protein